jgi:hypothetical protein
MVLMTVLALRGIEPFPQTEVFGSVSDRFHGRWFGPWCGHDTPPLTPPITSSNVRRTRTAGQDHLLGIPEFAKGSLGGKLSLAAQVICRRYYGYIGGRKGEAIQ